MVGRAAGAAPDPSHAVWLTRRRHIEDVQETSIGAHAAAPVMPQALAVHAMLHEIHGVREMMIGLVGIVVETERDRRVLFIHGK